ncbi:MAG: alpha/beta hydrolase [Desulfobacteraceae bacterium]|nr:MAG: alpha/beta hydrolase [Desulfobacteraceae bacterium]
MEGVNMKKLITILIVCVGLFSLMILILPKLTSKESCTYEQAAEKSAKGKFVTVGEKKVHYIEKGSGEPVILIHGFLYHTTMWKNNMDALAENFKVYTIDLFGWGFSERLNENEYSFERYAKQVTGFMDALNIQKASLVGQSMGGGTAVYVAAHHPGRVKRLILVDPAVLPYPETITGRIYQLPFLGEFLNAIPGDALLKGNIERLWFYDGSKVTQEYVKEVAQPLCIKGSYAGLMYILRNVLKAPFVEKEAHLLAKRNKPILIIHGREDKAVPLDNSKALNDLWTGSSLVIFEKAGHTPQEEHPEKFNKLAVDFLSR